MSAIRYWDGRRIDLDAAVVMPDHAHAMFRILDGSHLSAILHSIKGFSAKEVNKRVGGTGSVWLDETFDHIIRHGAELEEKLEYIRQNSVKRGLSDSPEDYRLLYVQDHRQDACATDTIKDRRQDACVTASVTSRQTSRAGRRTS